MSVFDTLPAHPLTYAERQRLRDRDDVAAVTVIGTASIHRRDERTQNATDIVVLREGTVYALAYVESGWSVDVLQRNADRRDHLRRALDRLDHRPSTT